jgi:hypothetical protein
MSARRIGGALAVVAAWAALVGPARADAPPDLAQAAQLYDDGKRSFDLGDFPRAIVSWEASYRLSSAPLLLFNLGQAYRLAGDCGRANHFYTTYLRVEPAPPNPTELSAAMTKCAGVAPTGVRISARAVVPAPAAQASPPVAPGAESQPSKPLLRLAGAITLAAGGVAALASASYALVARRSATELAAQPDGTAWTPALAALEQRGATAATRARVLAVVSVAALAGGATLWWLGRRRSGVAVHVAVAPGHGEAVLACAF